MVLNSARWCSVDSSHNKLQGTWTYMHSAFTGTVLRVEAAKETLKVPLYPFVRGFGIALVSIEIYQVWIVLAIIVAVSCARVALLK